MSQYIIIILISPIITDIEISGTTITGPINVTSIIAIIITIIMGGQFTMHRMQDHIMLFKV